MTRFETVREHLREFGPKSSREIGAVFGWPMSTASAVMSHASAYGYVEQHGRRPVESNSNAPLQEILWRPRATLIRQPGQGGVRV